MRVRGVGIIPPRIAERGLAEPLMFRIVEGGGIPPNGTRMAGLSSMFNKSVGGRGIGDSPSILSCVVKVRKYPLEASYCPNIKWTDLKGNAL